MENKYRLGSTLLGWGVTQNDYKKQYIILANYMAGIRNTVLDTSDIPIEYQNDVKKCFDDIQEVVSIYARTIGTDLRDVPAAMLEDMEKITKLLPSAISAADRLYNKKGSEEDKNLISDVLDKSLSFAKKGLKDCGYIIENIDSFCKGKENGDSYLKDIEDNAKKIVETLAKSNELYEGEKAKIQEQIDKLNAQVKAITAAEVGTGVGVGVFLALGVFTIGLMVSGGAGAPLVGIAIGVMGVALAAGGVAFALGTSEIHKIEAAIEEYGKTMDSYTAKIYQVDLMSQTYSAMLDSLDAVKNALLAIQSAWKELMADLEELLKEVKNARTDSDNQVWDKASAELKNISDIFENTIKPQVQEMDISTIKVSDGKYDFAMTDEKLQSIYDQSKKIDFIRYLRTA
ncbi:MAG: hypothetical protein IJP90_07575 [Treponema sp.]|nr:hypothetical protein [Treponema sp.]